MKGGTWAADGALEVATDEVEIRMVPPHLWRDTVSLLRRHDHTFCDLHVTGPPGAVELRAAFIRDGRFQMITCLPDPQHAPTIVYLVPAADSAQREAAELSGIVFPDRH